MLVITKGLHLNTFLKVKNIKAHMSNVTFIMLLCT